MCSGLFGGLSLIAVCVAVAVPTYVLGPNKKEHESLFPEDGELCPNVFSLGKEIICFRDSG